MPVLTEIFFCQKLKILFGNFSHNCTTKMLQSPSTVVAVRNLITLCSETFITNPAPVSVWTQPEFRNEEFTYHVDLDASSLDVVSSSSMPRVLLYCNRILVLFLFFNPLFMPRL